MYTGAQSAVQHGLNNFRQLPARGEEGREGGKAGETRGRREWWVKTMKRKERRIFGWGGEEGWDKAEEGSGRMIGKATKEKGKRIV